MFRPYNVAMATTTAVMKATKGIVVSEVFCESRVALVVHRKPTRLLQCPQTYQAILRFYDLKAQGEISLLLIQNSCA